MGIRRKGIKRKRIRGKDKRTDYGRGLIWRRKERKDEDKECYKVCGLVAILSRLRKGNRQHRFSML